MYVSLFIVSCALYFLHRNYIKGFDDLGSCIAELLLELVPGGGEREVRSPVPRAVCSSCAVEARWPQPFTSSGFYFAFYFK